MSDFSFLKTGFDLAESDKHLDEDFTKKIVSILAVLSEEACNTAIQFSKCCGRDAIHGKDIVKALKYEAHEFFEKDIEANVTKKYKEQQNIDYNNEDSENNDNSSEYETSENEDELEECYTDVFVDGDKSFYNKVIKYEQEWNNWKPNDPIINIMKKSIDKAENSLLN